jgi:hypothetical protein
MIRGVNWNPRAQIPIQTAVRVLSDLEFIFTAELGPANAFLQQAVWVRLAQPTPASSLAAPSLQPILALHGAASISGDRVIWKLSDPNSSVTNALKSGGLILIDLDCDYLADASGADVSGSAAILAGLKPPVRPGGIFRSWLQVAVG